MGDGVSFTHLVQDRDHWLTLVHTAINRARNLEKRFTQFVNEIRALRKERVNFSASGYVHPHCNPNTLNSVVLTISFLMEPGRAAAV
jgi:hypothetical protein